jgi:hypothetical protein
MEAAMAGEEKLAAMAPAPSSFSLFVCASFVNARDRRLSKYQNPIKELHSAVHAH